MKLKDITNESKVAYKTLPTVRFRVKHDISFEDLKNHPDMLKHMGPHTVVFDVSHEERVKSAPYENKWNAMKSIWGSDTDEIICAKTKDDGWYCLAINVMV